MIKEDYIGKKLYYTSEPLEYLGETKARVHCFYIKDVDEYYKKYPPFERIDPEGKKGVIKFQDRAGMSSCYLKDEIAPGIFYDDMGYYASTDLKKLRDYYIKNIGSISPKVSYDFEDEEYED